MQLYYRQMTNLEVEKQPLNGGAKQEHVHTEKTNCSSEGSIVFILGLICGTFSAVCGKMVRLFLYLTLFTCVVGLRLLF